MAERRKTKRLAPPPKSKLAGTNANVAQNLVSHKHLLVITKVIDPEIEAEIARIQNKSTRTVADIVLLCLLRFRQIRAVMTRIPKTAEAWLNVQLQMIKRKMGPIKYLSDKDIKKIIVHVRLINARRHPEVTYAEDPDLPSCFYWNIEQVGQWLASCGYSHLREMFRTNYISGRKLISLDASALSKMGLKYFNDIQDLAGKIREILKIPRPNMMRALMCKVPFEQYLQARQWSGESYDDITFEKFCENNGYPYLYLKNHPLAIIECARELTDYLSAFSELKRAGADGRASEHKSLNECPTVEFTVRHILIRDKVVSELINELLKMGFSLRTKHELQAINSLGAIFNQGFEELGLNADEVSKRLEFGRLIAEEMLNEVFRTQRILQDMSKFKQFLKDKNISEETIAQMQEIAKEFFSSAANVASLLALGELDLESIFRQEPEFNAFVDGIIEEAEGKLNEMVPDAEAFIDEIIRMAESRVMDMEFPHLEEKTAESVRGYAKRLLSDMSEGRILNVEEVKNRRLNDEVLTGRGTRTITPFNEHAEGVSPRNSVGPFTGGDTSRTVGYFTIDVRQPQGLLSRKLGGYPTEATPNRKTFQPFVEGPSGDFTNLESQDIKTMSSPRLQLLQTLSDSPTITISNLKESTKPSEPNKENVDPELLTLVLDHVVYEVIQEALTQVLEDVTSTNETRQIMLTLEELKSSCKSQAFDDLDL